jgi:hypothetical protein
MANDRLYRKSIFLGLAYKEAFVNPSAPTAAELNNANYVIDLTCALWEESTEFTLGDPTTDDGLTFCDDAGSTTTTSQNPTIVYTALRDEDRVAAGLYNNAFDHLAFPDINYYAIERVGKANTAPFAIGDSVRLVAVKTDQPVDVLDKDANALLQQTFLKDGFTLWNFKLVA